jgi:hypothetical protein
VPCLDSSSNQKEGGRAETSVVVILFKSSIENSVLYTVCAARVPCYDYSRSSCCVLLGRFSSVSFALGLDFVPAADFSFRTLLILPSLCAEARSICH